MKGYRERYEKLVKSEWFKKIYGDKSLGECPVEIPELEDSDEENIKKLIEELSQSLRAANCQNDACGGGHESRIKLLEWAIAWLEKQKPVKTEWTEDDKKMIDDIVGSLENYKDYLMDEECDYGAECVAKRISWLNVLKKRMEWKPSTEEIEALRQVTYFREGVRIDKHLDNLYDELLKLV